VHISYTRPVQTKALKPWQEILLGLIFMVAGIGLLFFAVSTIKTYNEKKSTFIETTSKVVDYKYNNEGLQAIIVEYIVDGQNYQKISNSYSNMPKRIGTEVSIKYNPENPGDAIWSNDSTNIVMPIAGALFNIVGIALIISSIKNSKKQKLLEDPFVEQENGLYSNVITSDQSLSSNDENNSAENF